MTECEVCTSPASHVVTFTKNGEADSFTVCADHAAFAVQNGAEVAEL